MADNALKTLFTNLADAIRETLPDVGKMSPYSFPSKIREVASAGGGSSDLVKYVIFMSHDGSVEYGRKPTIDGDDCLDPLEIGLFDTPTKESDAQNDYSHNGWSLSQNGSANADALKNVTEDRVVYASYTSSVRYYTVRFYDDATLVNTVQVTYGANISDYVYAKDGYAFNGWTPNPTNVIADIDCYGSWTESVKLEDASWTTIAQKSADGSASEIWKIGDTKTISVINSSGATINVVMEIVDFDKDDLADGSGKAGITFYCKNVVDNLGQKFNNESKFSASEDGRYQTYRSYAGGWKNCDARTWLNGDFFNALDSELQEAIKTVQKPYVYSKYKGTTALDGIAEDKIWVMSVEETNLNGNGYAKFTNNSSRIKKNPNDYNSNYLWFLRELDRSFSVSSLDTSVSAITKNGELDTSQYGATMYAPSTFGFCI